jgi:hypothetical protein
MEDSRKANGMLKYRLYLCYCLKFHWFGILQHYDEFSLHCVAGLVCAFTSIYML